MSATKTWNIGDVLTASDLNSNFSKLPYSTYQFSYTYSGTISANSGVTFAVVYPTSRFSVAPIVTVSSNSAALTAYVYLNNAGTVTVGLFNNGASVSGATTLVYGQATQWASGSASG